jgi:hypothetical protein
MVMGARPSRFPACGKGQGESKFDFQSSHILKSHPILFALTGLRDDEQSLVARRPFP